MYFRPVSWPMRASQRPCAPAGQAHACAEAVAMRDAAAHAACRARLLVASDAAKLRGAARVALALAAQGHHQLLRRDAIQLPQLLLVARDGVIGLRLASAATHRRQVVRQRGLRLRVKSAEVNLLPVATRAHTRRASAAGGGRRAGERWQRSVRTRPPRYALPACTKRDPGKKAFEPPCVRQRRCGWARARHGARTQRPVRQW